MVDDRTIRVLANDINLPIWVDSPQLTEDGRCQNRITQFAKLDDKDSPHVTHIVALFEETRLQIDSG